MSSEKGEGLLPVHGFVLAGGKSSRMGLDKATLEFRGRPMVEIAVEKLREFCADVSIAGNREDLSSHAEVVPEERVDAGPAAGVEAGLKAAKQEWALFVPVDVPLVPVSLLRRWAEVALEMGSNGDFDAFHLHVDRDQPAFCILRRSCAIPFSEKLGSGERRLSKLLHVATKGFHRIGPDELYPTGYPSVETMDRWFMIINTPDDLVAAEGFWENGTPSGMTTRKAKTKPRQSRDKGMAP